MSVSRSSSGCLSSFLTYEELTKKKLERGDLIEFDRGSYNHWAMYAGTCDNGTHWCFHVTTADGDFEKKDTLMASSNSGSKAIAAIKKHKLKDIAADNDSKKPSMLRINNKTREANQKKCASRPVDQVLAELEKQKDQKIPYKLSSANCEHFVTKWKYGEAWSRQVEIAEAVSIGIAAVGAVAGVFMLIGGIFKLFSGSQTNEYDGERDSD